jgi:PAS domain S-box-containing protein
MPLPAWTIVPGLGLGAVLGWVLATATLHRSAARRAASGRFLLPCQEGGLSAPAACPAFEHDTAVKLLIDPEDGRILEANSAAVAFYGYPHDELCSLNITDLNTLAPEEVHREMDLARLEERTYFRFRHRLASGEVRAVDVYSGPLQFAGRTVLHSIIHDVTERERLVAELQDALDHVKTLHGLLPICARCKKIRDESDRWEQLEKYVTEHSDAMFTHGLCPECEREAYREAGLDPPENRH